MIEDVRIRSAQRQQQSGLPAPSVTPPAAAAAENVAATSEEVAAQLAAYESTAAASQVDQQAHAAARTQAEQPPVEQQPAQDAAVEAEEQQEGEQPQQAEEQQQGEQQPHEPLDLQLDLKAHPELAPLADAAFTLAALASSGLAAPLGLPRNDTLAVHCLHSAALAGGVDAQLALADRWFFVERSAGRREGRAC